ncbi:hypothetical protein CcCBS67573_g06057 [Chytriomyces confervae]|uniref:peptidylprolyl isomerase n=1 Tax=Chytriomyces confervae TaxID=246404 RepID=A0A507F5V7_9FUNG|nr:hypothetical protein CcCBS67573_g06057 [Chytriomyces confervae]
MTENEEFLPISSDGRLRKKILQEGNGDLVSPKSSVSVHYTGYLHPQGTKFDSSLDRGTPLEFNVSEGCVIKGWDEGLLTMRVGEKCQLICEPDYAYGEEGNPPTIPPNATLMFEMELVSSKPLEDPVPVKIKDASTAKATGNSQFSSADYKSATQSYKYGISRLEYSWGATPSEMAEIKALKLSLNTNLAACCLKTKDLKEAIEACNSALELDPVNVKALFRMGQAHAGLAQFEKAEGVLKRALEISPKDTAIIHEIANLAAKEKELKNKEKQMYAAMFK